MDKSYIPASEFHGDLLAPPTITGYIVTIDGDHIISRHREPWRAAESARKVYATAYALVAGSRREMREFKGEIPEGWRYIEPRYMLEGRLYYQNATGSAYLPVIHRGKTGDLLSYMPSLAVRMA